MSKKLVTKSSKKVHLNFSLGEMAAQHLKNFEFRLFRRLLEVQRNDCLNLLQAETECF